ncbi:MAG: hypothetical protein KKC55_03275, partial [Gammaproteobacteria bacterium]|nr:hypothetical protein [Gammaproteobacteria bacterium]
AESPAPQPTAPPPPPSGAVGDPVDGAAGARPAPALPSPAAGQTAQEQMDAIDQAFGESLGVFDERLAREQTGQQQQREAAAAEQAARDAAGGAAGDDEGGDGSSGAPPPPSGGVYDDASEPGEGDGRQGPSSPGNRAGPTPPDVGDGRDDDIVARQLREAAQRETDPELRARLWDEYRAYKRSQ